MPAVKDIKSKNGINFNVNSSVLEAAELMTNKGIGCLVVIRNDMTVGMVTKRDFARKIIAKRVSYEAKVSEIMSKYRITVGPDTMTWSIG